MADLCRGRSGRVHTPVRTGVLTGAAEELSSRRASTVNSMGRSFALVDGLPADSDLLLSAALHPYGCYTSMVVQSLAVRGLSLHVARLQRGCEELFGVQLGRDRVISAIRAHAGQQEGDIRLRISVLPGTWDFGRPVDVSEVALLTVSTPHSDADSGNPREMAVWPVEWHRPLSHIKGCGLLMPLYYRREAQRRGFDDVLFVRQGQILEGATWSVLAWQQQRLLLPDGPVLESVTASLFVDVARSLGFGVEHRPVSIEDLVASRLVHGANVGHPVQPIERVGEIAMPVDVAFGGLLLDAYGGLSAESIV